MRLYKYATGIAALWLISCAPTNKNGTPKNYEVTPVLLHVDATAQADSIGFNLVTSIAELVYPKILTGELPLWEDSKRQKILDPQLLISSEKTAKKPFVNGSDLFLHEYWQLFKRNFDFSVEGFSFVGQDKNGKNINYGYIHGPDLIQLLRLEKIPTNANGPASLTFWNALHSYTFNFTLVQFGTDNFSRNPRLSTALQYQAVYDQRIFREFYTPNNTKRIAYRVLPPDINSNTENKAFYKIIEHYINDNKHTILNAGGDAHFSHILRKPWLVANLVVHENWGKYKNIPIQTIEGIELFIDKHTVYLGINQLREMNIQINLQGLEEYLSEKRFDFLVETINDQEIPAQKSEKLYNALLNNTWNKITYK